MNPDIAALLAERLAPLQPLKLAIEDESSRHAGHAGASAGGHFKLTIVSAAFAGKSTLVRHRMVYEAAGDLLRGGIHALGIHALAPDEV